MNKGVATEIILTMGVLVASGVLLLQLRGVFYGQTKLSQEEVVSTFADDIENIVDKAVAVTGNANFIYYPAIKSYTLTVKSDTVLIYDKISKKTASFTKTSTNLQDMAFEDSEIIYVIKVEDRVYILGKCREKSESCSYSIMCCPENPYCWGSTFICHENCADLGENAADSEACCSSFLNVTTGKCDEPPFCPAERICEGAPESIVIGGEDCCPVDKPVCIAKHCCPVDKPKWCNKPLSGEARCMSEVDFNDPTKCKKSTFVILLIQINTQVPNFDSLAQTCKNTWVSLSPLSKCPDVVEVIAVTDKVCSVNECNALGGLISCAINWGYGGKYTRIVGVKHGSSVCGARGYTMKNGEVVVTIDQGIGSVCSHELGHTFGLCDEGYGNSLCPHCTSGICNLGGLACFGGGHCCPNKPELNSIMCSSNICGRGCSYGSRFASTSYAHLEVELNKYCG